MSQCDMVQISLHLIRLNMPFPNEHFPLFTHGILRAQSECPASRQTGSYVGGPMVGGHVPENFVCRSTNTEYKLVKISE